MLTATEVDARLIADGRPIIGGSEGHSDNAGWRVARSPRYTRKTSTSFFSVSPSIVAMTSTCGSSPEPCNFSLSSASS